MLLLAIRCPTRCGHDTYTDLGGLPPTCPANIFLFHIPIAPESLSLDEIEPQLTYGAPDHDKRNSVGYGPAFVINSSIHFSGGNMEHRAMINVTD